MPIDFDEQDQPVIQIAPTDVGFSDPAEPRRLESLERISRASSRDTRSPRWASGAGYFASVLYHSPGDAED